MSYTEDWNKQQQCIILPTGSIKMSATYLKLNSIQKHDRVVDF